MVTSISSARSDFRGNWHRPCINFKSSEPDTETCSRAEGRGGSAGCSVEGHRLYDRSGTGRGERLPVARAVRVCALVFSLAQAPIENLTLYFCSQNAAL